MPIPQYYGDNMEIAFQNLEDACISLKEAIEKVQQSFSELREYLEYHHGQLS